MCHRFNSTTNKHENDACNSQERILINQKNAVEAMCKIQTITNNKEMREQQQQRYRSHRNHIIVEVKVKEEEKSQKSVAIERQQQQKQLLQQQQETKKYRPLPAIVFQQQRNPEDLSLFYCKSCRFTFYGEEVYLTHIQLFHAVNSYTSSNTLLPAVRPIITSNNSHALLLPLHYHYPNTYCNICSRTHYALNNYFIHIMLNNSHYRARRPNNNICVCFYCAKKYKRYGYLQRHYLHNSNNSNHFQKQQL